MVRISVAAMAPMWLRFLWMWRNLLGRAQLTHEGTQFPRRLSLSQFARLLIYLSFVCLSLSYYLSLSLYHFLSLSSSLWSVEEGM